MKDNCPEQIFNSYVDEKWGAKKHSLQYQLDQFSNLKITIGS
jgi:hypothetical protein